MRGIGRDRLLIGLALMMVPLAGAFAAAPDTRRVPEIAPAFIGPTSPVMLVRPNAEGQPCADMECQPGQLRLSEEGRLQAEPPVRQTYVPRTK